MKKELMIIDDQKLIREGLKCILEKNNINVIGVADNCSEALRQANSNQPSVVLINLDMNENDKFKGIEQLKNTFPKAKIIVLTYYGNVFDIKAALLSGASGCLLFSSTFDELQNAISQVLSNTVFLGIQIKNLVLADYLAGEKNVQHFNHGISNREKEIIKCIGKGYSTREISEKLFISPKTVGTHKQNIIKKLKMKSSAALLKFALTFDTYDSKELKKSKSE